MTRSEILDAAKKCVTGGRDTDYGKPEDNFGIISRLWNTYIYAKYDKLLPLFDRDVAMMMALVKIARTIKSDNVDSFVDLAGYAACGGELATC